MSISPTPVPTPLPPTPAAAIPASTATTRATAAFDARYGNAVTGTKFVPAIAQTPNGDEAGFADKSGSYSKGLAQGHMGIVNTPVFAAFRAALGTPTTYGTANFEAPPFATGPAGKQNGPQGAFALQPVGLDSQNFVSPPAPAVGDPVYASELVELYWASLLRDVPFTEYNGNSIAQAAAMELQGMPGYIGPKDAGGAVTPHLLFRGGSSTPGLFAGETVGPYVSQLCLGATYLGAQKISQQMRVYSAGRDFMTSLGEWFNIQQGMAPTASLVADPIPRFLYNGRALSSFTHDDELYQTYLVAYLVMKTWGLQPNPGVPYGAYKYQKAFGTFGGPDIAATLGAIAKAAINAVWYQKWIVHLRARPEAAGGLVHLRQTGAAPMPAAAAALGADILSSQALAASFAKYGSFLLSQAFPEGSPTHPAYPTGHGTVAGACITALKFFFNCDPSIKVQQFMQPIVPALDGQALVAYTQPDAAEMTVHGELNKLGHNISFGHGIHGGIHWRSDTDQSLLLGEAVALNFLQDQAYGYKEKFSITITKMDGTQATIHN